MLRTPGASSLIALALAAASCGGGGGQAPAKPSSATPAPASTSTMTRTSTAAPGPSISEEAEEEAEDIFKTRCSPCHGEHGKGDGAASAGLVPKPRDFTSAEWQASVTDDHIEKIVMYGGTAVGKAPTMPPNPDLTARPDVIRALRAHVRELGGKSRDDDQDHE